MVPKMSRHDIKRHISGMSPHSSRFVLVCEGAEWCIFLAAAHRLDGAKLNVNFWEHETNSDGGGLFHYEYEYNDDTYSVYTDYIRAIFHDEEQAVAVARALKSATEKLKEEIRGPMVSYQMALMVAIA